MKKIKVEISADEKYPFYTIKKAEEFISGTANAYGNNSWKLKTIEDVLKMNWLNFFDIPIDKYEWIKSVYSDLNKVNAYLQKLLKN